MQSFIQYRKFGKHVEAQLKRGTGKAANLNLNANDAPFRNESSQLAREDPSGDLEKGEHARSSEESERRESIVAPEDESVGTPDDEEARFGHSLSKVSTQRTEHTVGTRLGLTLTGINVRDRTTNEGGNRSNQVFVVGYEGDNDPLNPHNWSISLRIFCTMQVASIGWVVGFASAVDSTVLTRASQEFGVSKVVESLATGIYLIGFGAGALFAGPFSETFGRNPIYIATLLLYMIFIMASGLAPNIGAQLTFRFLAGFFGSTPLTCAGGSLADLWSPLERVYAFPIFANAAFMGPIFGPVVGGFVAQSSLISWRWTEWITLILSALVFASITLFQPETYLAVLLKWKAEHMRRLTGDNRYCAPLEIKEETLVSRLQRALYRPFILTFREPIIMLVALYLTVIYIILFTFLDGYDHIFGEIHGTSQGITGLLFLGIAFGLCMSSALVPLIYKWAKRDLKKIREKGGTQLPPEFRLWYSMLGGAIAIPISLLWMGWTSYPSISLWSPLIASVFFGYGILCVFISSYQYIIDGYEIFAASALASVTLIRYFAAGGMVVAGIHFYENLGVQWTLTILAAISALMVPVPYIFYRNGHKIRAKSKYAVNST